MDDILSQIIAYAPNKIDTEVKARAMVQGPRNMYAGGQLVSNTVDGSRPGYSGRDRYSELAGTSVEDFIIGGTEATEGIAGQLTRLGSGRDYKGKLEMMKKLEEAEKLNKLDIDKMKPNAKGGLQTLLGE